MLDGWGEHPVVAQTVREASDALSQDIGELIRSGPKEALALTTNTQPVMLVAGVAAYRVWMDRTGVAPSVVAGHSLGEYAALVAAGVMTLHQAAPLVRLRAQAMQDAVPVGTGSMAAATDGYSRSGHRARAGPGARQCDNISTVAEPVHRHACSGSETFQRGSGGWGPGVNQGAGARLERFCRKHWCRGCVGSSGAAALCAGRGGRDRTDRCLLRRFDGTTDPVHRSAVRRTGRVVGEPSRKRTLRGVRACGPLNHPDVALPSYASQPRRVSPVTTAVS